MNTSVAGDFTYTFTPDVQFCALQVSIVIKIENCFIQKGISPNGDEYNQFFDLSNFNVNKLEIFNRYGRKVYSRVNYKKEWEGQTNSGDELPDGTYYYVIEFADREATTGWIYINRQQ
ncbi:MAG: gliding motility-associated C-terminal domain-containing protein [Flavobacterium sp.]|nr:gliding motility-associated C-terminal domain-containing protein [Flavobacterium sp.]